MHILENNNYLPNVDIFSWGFSFRGEEIQKVLSGLIFVNWQFDTNNLPIQLTKLSSLRIKYKYFIYLEVSLRQSKVIIFNRLNISIIIQFCKNFNTVLYEHQKTGSVSLNSNHITKLGFSLSIYPVCIYLFSVSNGITWAMCEICLKLNDANNGVLVSLLLTDFALYFGVSCHLDLFYLIN